MKKFLLMLSLVVTALISASAQTSENALKYALGGNLQDATIVNYIADEAHLFAYDEATGLWTKTLAVPADKIANGYFRIQTADNKRWWSGSGFGASYKVTGDFDFVEITNGATMNSYFKLDNPGDRTVTFTIKEEGGKSYLKISGLDNTASNESWAVNGTITAGADKGMTDAGNGEYTYSLGNVSVNDSFNVVFTGENPKSWGSSEVLSAGGVYTLQEGGAAMKFDADYTNAAIVWTPATGQLAVSGTVKPDENQMKYCLSGCLDGVSLVSKYTDDASHLFTYNKETGEWTKTGYLSQSGNHYMSVWSAAGKRYMPKGKFSLPAGDMDFTELVNSYSNIQITDVDKDYAEITFTIKEIDGVPYMKISGFSDTGDVPVVDSWAVAGSLTQGTDAAMTAGDAGVYTYSAASVSKGSAFVLKAMSNGSALAIWGGNGAEISAGGTYTLVEDGAQLPFDADYTDVVLTWNSASHTLAVAGKAVTQAVDNSKKYSLGGNLEVMPAVFRYDESLLFDYDESTGVWTKEINTTATGGTYFDVFDASGQRWIYAGSQALYGNENVMLTAATTYHNEFKGSGSFRFTLTETNGIPYLKITNLEAIGNPQWLVVSENLTNGLEQEMTAASETLITYAFGQVQKGDSFRVVYAVGDDKKYYGVDGEIVPNTEYAISENYQSVKFADGYNDVTVSINPATGMLSFTGRQDTGSGEVKPSATTPAGGSTVLSIDRLSQVTFTFNKYPNGIGDIYRTANLELTIFKDGVAYRTIDATSVKNVRINGNNPNVLEINFEPLTEAGTYSITLPQDFIKLDPTSGGSLGSDDGEEKVYPDSELKNAAYTLTFTVKAVIDFKLSPEPGEVYADQLESLTMEYPEGAVITVNNSVAAPSLIYIDETTVTASGVAYQTKETHTTYSVSVDGNVVTLTAKNPAAISMDANKAHARYYRVAIPASAWSVELNGQSETFLGREYGEYVIVKKVEETNEKVSIAPSNAREVKPAELQTIKVLYPETYTFNEWSASNPFGKKVGYNVGYLRKTEDATAEEGVNYGTYSLSEIDKENRILTLTLKLDASVAEIDDAFYCIMLVNQMFVVADGSKSTNLYFTGYKVNKNAGETPTDLDAFDAEKIVYEHAFDASERDAAEMACRIDFAMNPLFTDFSRTSVSIAPAEEYAQISDFTAYKAPEYSQKLAKGEDGNGYAQMNFFTAGVYKMTVANAAEGTFKASEYELTITVKPTIESMGVTINSAKLTKAESGDGYNLVYDPESASTLIEAYTGIVDNADVESAMAQMGVKFFFRYADETELAEYGSDSKLDLAHAAEVGGFDLAVEENGQRSATSHISLTAAEGIRDAFDAEKIVYSHAFDAAERDAAEMACRIDFAMNPLFTNFDLTSVSIAPAEEYAQISDFTAYKAPEYSQKLAKGEDGNGYAQMNFFTAGVYKMTVGNAAEGTFKASEYELTITVKPTIESMGVTINSAKPTKAESGDGYSIVFTPESASALIEAYTGIIDNADVESAMAQMGVKFFFRYADETELAEYGTDSKLDLAHAAEVGGFDLAVEENGQRSATSHIDATADLSGIGSIESDAEAVWYDLIGNRVANPANGIYIRVLGGKATKHMLR